MAAMAADALRSGSVTFARRRGISLFKPVGRTPAIERDRPPSFAMQKVVGSSPIIRFESPANVRFQSPVWKTVAATWLHSCPQSGWMRAANGG
jgi:hypothetical protein